MADRDNDKGANAAGGTLKDEAAGNGGEVSFGSLMMKDFGAGGKEESESRKAEALSSEYLLSGSQGKNEISEILARRGGDSEVLADDDGIAKTVYQQRILEAARAARVKYFEARDNGDHLGRAKHGAMLVRLVDALTKEGLSEAPEVLELIGEDEVDELSVVLDAGVAEGVLKKMDASQVAKAQEPERDIGAEIGREFEGEVTGPETDADVGRETAGEPSGIPEDANAPDTGLAQGTETDYSDVEEDPAVQDTEDSLEDDAQIDDIEGMDLRGYEGELPPPLPVRGAKGKVSVDGSQAEKPKPAIDFSMRELEKIQAGGLLLTPLGDEERESIGKLDGLSPSELREMASRRREQASLVLSKERPKRGEMGKWYVDFMVRLQNEGLDTEDSLRAMHVAKMELMSQAGRLDSLAAEREASQAAQRKEPIKPKRPSAVPRKASISPKPAAAPEAEVDSWAEAISETGQEGAFFKSGESGAFKLFERKDGTIDVDALYGKGRAAAQASEKKEEVHVMGTSGEPGKRRERTALGIPAAEVTAPGAVADKAKESGRPEAPGEEQGTARFGTQILAAGAAGKEHGPAGLGVMAAKEGDGAGELTRTQMFAQFDRDPEMAKIATEGSGALSLGHIQEISGVKGSPIPAPDLDRVSTGQMPAVAEKMNRIAGMGGTTPKLGVAAEEDAAPEVPPYGVDADAEPEGKGEGAAEAERDPADMNQTSIVVPEAIAGDDGKPKIWAEDAFAHTRLSSLEGALLGAVEGQGPGKRTRNEKPKEDFSVYGDIYYAVEKAYMESSGIPPSFDNMNNFPKMLTDAIKKAEQISARTKFDPKKGETQVGAIEDQRVGRLKKFKEDFLEVQEGQAEPRKSLLAYNEWLANKKREYSEIRDVHELLSKALAGDLRVENKHGVSPGEYSRVAVLRLCNAAIKKGTLSELEEAKVEKLREMLEPVARGESDIYAQTIAADAAYEMIVGFATKRERARTRQLEHELGKYKLTVAEYEGKREVMVNILAEVLFSVKNTEADSGKAKDKVKQAIMVLAPDDPFERGKYLRLITDAQAGAGGKAGAEIRAEAEKIVSAGISGKETWEASQLKAVSAPVGAPHKQGPTQDELRAALYGTGKPKQPQAHAVPTPKPHGPVARSFGTVLTMAAGAALLAGGLWLGQHGILSLGGGAENAVGKPAVAQVEMADENAEELPAGVANVDAGKAPAKKIAEAKPANDAGKADAGVDAGVDPAIKAVRALQGQQAQPEKYTRDKAGLKMALDSWCQEERGLLVSGGMLRASYAAVEGRLDGKVLPEDAEWAQTMLSMKFPNRMVEIAVMSDIARGSPESDNVETRQGLLAEKYAAYMRLSVLLGNRAGNPKSFETTIMEANKKGIALPPLDKESHMGKIEGLKVGERCLFSAYHETVVVTMGKIVGEAVGTGISKKAFMDKVRAVLGANAERIESLSKDANYEANSEEGKDYCRALTGGKRGAAALERAGIVAKRWEDGREKAKAKDARYQQSVDDVLGSAPDAKTNAPKAGGKKEKGRTELSPCSGKDGLGYLSCVTEQRQKKMEQQAERERREARNGSNSPCENLRGSFYYYQCLDEHGAKRGKDNGEKKMHAPKGKESGSAGNAPRNVRY